MRVLTLLAVVTLLAAVHPTLSHAQISLYEGRLPEGFAFVRFANTTADAMDLAPAFTDPVKLGTEAGARISQYRVVENVTGKSLGVANKEGGHLDLRLTPGKFHTFLITAGGAGLAGKLVTDVTEYNQLKSKLSFYNAAPSCTAASLLLEPTNQAVFKDVETAAMRTRSINPVTEAKVRATCGTAKIPTLDLGELNAGALYSVWLMAPSGMPAIFLAQDFIAPYQR